MSTYYLSFDILSLIFQNINDKNNGFNFRLINKECNKIFMEHFNKINVNFCARKTYIKINECMICNIVIPFTITNKYCDCNENKYSNNSNESNKSNDSNCQISEVCTIKNSQYYRLSRLNQIVYEYDMFPHKCIVYCDNKNCKISALKRYITDLRINNITPFCKIKDDVLMYKKMYNLGTLRKYKDKWFIKYLLERNINKYYIFNYINYITFNKDFQWYIE